MSSAIPDNLSMRASMPFALDRQRGMLDGELIALHEFPDFLIS